MGVVLSRQGQVDGAIVQFREAIRANPKYAAAYDNLAENLVKQGKFEEALSYYGTSLTEEPSAVVYNKSGVVLMRLGRTDEAAEQFRKAIAMKPGFTEALNNLAAIH